jgi:DNA-binding CsgD family transcriptional regulator
MDWDDVERMARTQQVVIVEIGPWLLFRDANPPKPKAPLSPTEKRCLQAAADGKNPAVELGMGVSEVKRHFARAFTKLGTRDQASAVFAAMHAGFIE